MDNFWERLREIQEQFAKQPPAPPTEYDVAIGRRDGKGSLLPALTCIMEEEDFWGLEEDWMKAIETADETAGCYWMQVNGKRARIGLLLNEIIHLTGVIKTKTEGDA